MLKKDVSYATRVWDHYELYHQCLFLILGLITLIGLTFSSAKAENTTPKIPFKSVDDQMAILTEKLKLTPEQVSRFAPSFKTSRKNDKPCLKNIKGKGEGPIEIFLARQKP